MRAFPCYQGKYQGAKKTHPRATRISTLYDGAQTKPGRKSKAKIRAEQGENSSVHGIARTAGRGAPERSIDICESMTEVCAGSINL
jgi:hypothetical protein